MSISAGQDRFNQELGKWLKAMGAAAGVDATAFAVDRAKSEVLRDVKYGIMPYDVRSFADLHDHVDANGYGGAFRWSLLPSDDEGNPDSDECADLFRKFWDDVQGQVDTWISSGQMLKEFEQYLASQPTPRS